MANLIHYLKYIFFDLRYITSLFIRFSIVIITEYLYHNYGILYTDIDYHVFSDGANHLSKLESPYERETYRYTPILAFLMIPNIKIYYPIGKLFLCTIDVFVAFLIEKLLRAQEVSDSQNESLDEKLDNKRKQNLMHGKASLFYLYNPLTVVICTRGSADCIITFLVLLSLIFMEYNFYFLSALLYGFAVHFKIYPIIYAPALYLYLVNKEYINKQKDDNNKEPPYLFSFCSKLCYLIKKFIEVIKIFFVNLFKCKSLMFISVSASTFFVLLVLFYLWLGYKFLFEYLLYHVVRKDHRHNYSMFFYLIYLTYDTDFSKMISIIAFLPQILLIILVTFYLYKNINLCLIVLTMIFVAFNKVMTAQYFIWFFSLIPLIVNTNLLFGKKKLKGIILLSIWLFFEVIWNTYSHLLEYNGKNTFIEMWVIDVIFFVINCVCISEIIANNK